MHAINKFHVVRASLKHAFSRWRVCGQHGSVQDTPRLVAGKIQAANQPLCSQSALLALVERPVANQPLLYAERKEEDLQPPVPLGTQQIPTAPAAAQQRGSSSTMQSSGIAMDLVADQERQGSCAGEAPSLAEPQLHWGAPSIGSLHERCIAQAYSCLPRVPQEEQRNSFQRCSSLGLA
jgi:hypothetical protein